MARVEIGEHTLWDLAGDLFFARGNIYLHNGSVRGLEVAGGGATAVVDGSRPQPYQVSLEIVSGRLEGGCDCPAGQDGLFCKHCVAVGLAWLEEAGGETGGFGLAGGSGTADGSDLRGFLLSQDPQWLADELLRAADDNPLLRTRLQTAALHAAVAGVGEGANAALDVQAICRNLEKIIIVDGYIDWRSTPAYTSDIDEALDSLDGLLDNGFTDEVIDLAEHVLVILEEAAGGIDDSRGDMAAAIARVQEIHLRACEEGNPDRSRWAGGWPNAVPAAGGRCSTTPSRPTPRSSGTPGWPPTGRSSTGSGRNSRRWLRVTATTTTTAGAITTLKKNLARFDGDTDALVDVLAHDLSADHEFLGIARVLVEAGRDADALGWLERGTAAFPANPTRLNQMAAEIYRRAGREERAVELAWAEFVRSPSLAGYQTLAGYAGARSGRQAGEAPPGPPAPEGTREQQDAVTRVWPQWRERALGLLRGRPGAATLESPRPAWQRGQGYSTALVEVLLWEGDVDGAWQAAVHGGCNEQLWLRLARRRVADHPLDAVPILRRHAEVVIGMKQRDFYRTAATLLREARDLHERAGDADGFTRYLAQVRGAHRPKRALMEELDRASLKT